MYVVSILCPNLVKKFNEVNEYVELSCSYSKRLTNYGVHGCLWIEIFGALHKRPLTFVSSACCALFRFVTTPQVYGDGFRKAKAAYDAVGLETLLGHIKRYQAFPDV